MVTQFNNENKFDTNKIVEIFPYVESILHCGVYQSNLESNTLVWSEGVYKILGLAPFVSPASNELFSKFILPNDLELVNEAIKESKRTSKPYQIEFSIIDANGKHKRLYAENYLNSETNSNLNVYTGVVKDITERHALKKENEIKVIELNKSNARLQEFAYIASHDLQEPLRKISTFLDRFNIKFRSELKEEAIIYIDKMKNSATSMQNLLVELLSFSKLSVGKLDYEIVLLKKVFENVLSDLEFKIEETKTEIIIDELPEIEGYTSQLKQLFNNLLNNSMKFRKSNDKTKITIKCSPISSTSFPEINLLPLTPYIKIEVQDNGIGFEQEYAEKIFQVFQRLNAKTEYNGSGIGLSICKKIVDNHNGFIFAESQLGQGANFTILLPITHS